MALVDRSGLDSDLNIRCAEVEANDDFLTIAAAAVGSGGGILWKLKMDL